MQFTPETIKARFDELGKARDPLVSKRDSLWAELSEIKSGETKLTVKQAVAREAKIREEIKSFQAELGPIDAEYALCARALGSKVISAPIS